MHPKRHAELYKRHFGFNFPFKNPHPTFFTRIRNPCSVNMLAKLYYCNFEFRKSFRFVTAYLQLCTCKFENYHLPVPLEATQKQGKKHESRIRNSVIKIIILWADSNPHSAKNLGQKKKTKRKKGNLHENSQPFIGPTIENTIFMQTLV